MPERTPLDWPVTAHPFSEAAAMRFRGITEQRRGDCGCSGPPQNLKGLPGYGFRS
jgi:hypothetical protein